MVIDLSLIFWRESLTNEMPADISDTATMME